MTIAGLLLSCNPPGHNQTDSAQQQEATAADADRQIIIEELKRLRTVFASDDKEKIADIFSFPIANETVSIYTDNNSFNEQLAKSNNQVTRSMFISYYPGVAESLQIDQLNQLFRKLDIEQLLSKDYIEHDAIIKTEPCYHFYRVKIENQLVMLTIGTNSNTNYENKSASTDEVPENDSSMCEHVLWWAFIFDGKQLQFKEIAGAG